MVVLHVVRDPVVFHLLGDRQGPLGHLAVARIGQIDLADRRHVVGRLGERRHAEPRLGGQQGIEEAFQPAVVVAVFLGVGPGAELLAVVAEDHHRVRMPVGDLGQVVDRLFGIAEGDRVPQLLAPREDRHHAAVVLGRVVTGQVVVGQSGGLEVEVVEHGVLDAGGHEVAGERLLPNTLGDPHAADRRPQAVFEPLGVHADLAHPVAGRDHRQDRLEERAADDLNPPLGDQFGQPIDVARVVGVEPLHERAAGVQRDLQPLIAAEDFEEGPVAVLVGLLENVLKVADRLVIVENEGKADGLGHLRSCAGLGGVRRASGREAQIVRNTYFIGNGDLVYPIPRAGISCDSWGSISTSRRNAAASSGVTGLM